MTYVADSANGYDPDAVEGEEISILDASHVYAGEWMVMRITSHDKYGTADGGVVVAHNKSRKALRPVIDAEWDRAERLGTTIGIVYGHRWLRPGERRHSLIDDLIAEAEARDAAER